MIQRYAQSWFFRYRSGNSFSSTFCYDFSTKMFLMLYSINWPSFITWSPLLLEIMGNMCIVIVCYPGCDIMDFEINLIFQIAVLSTWPKSHDKNLNNLRTKRAFKVKQKTLSQTLEWAFKYKSDSFVAKERRSLN